jgi:hypothetical protein
MGPLLSSTPQGLANSTDEYEVQLKPLLPVTKDKVQVLHQRFVFATHRYDSAAERAADPAERSLGGASISIHCAAASLKWCVAIPVTPDGKQPDSPRMMPPQPGKSELVIDSTDTSRSGLQYGLPIFCAVPSLA